MFGRKRDHGHHEQPPAGRPVRLDPAKMARVWQAFLADASPPAPGPRFAFNISTFTGSEADLPGGPMGPPGGPATVNIPGVGPVEGARLHAAIGRFQELMVELVGPQAADPSHSSAWGPAQARAALDGLPALYAEGRLSQEQFAALEDLLQSVVSA